MAAGLKFDTSWGHSAKISKFSVLKVYLKIPLMRPFNKILKIIIFWFPVLRE